MQRIDSERDIESGIAALTALPNHGAYFARAFEATGLPPLRRRPEGFAELLRAIVGQQVSVASASAIWARLEAAGMVAPDPILAVSDDALRALGLSRSKARYARALAEAGIDFDALRRAPDAEILETLTRVTGIGRWTAEIYALMSLGRA
ncbi:MAG: 3-methyladenine DNA glycosylase, partial [Proteobacteria bacterium]